MADLTPMKYRVVTAHNPKNGETLLRPVVTDRETMSMKQLVAYAMKAQFVRGQQKDMEGLLGGFIQAMKDRAEAGYTINVNDWFIISGRLKGQVGENRQLTDKNEYHVTITATKDLKVDIDNFSWTNVDDSSAVVKCDTVMSVGGTPSVLTKDKEIIATGKNMQYSTALGDVVSITYADLETPIVIVPTESDYVHMKFAWPEALNDLDDGTVLTFKFKTRGGVEGAPDQVVTKVVTFKVA